MNLFCLYFYYPAKLCILSQITSLKGILCISLENQAQQVRDKVFVCKYSSLSTAFSVLFHLSAEKYFGAKSLFHLHNSRRVFGALEKVYHTLRLPCVELTGNLLVKNNFFIVALEIFGSFCICCSHVIWFHKAFESVWWDLGELSERQKGEDQHVIFPIQDVIMEWFSVSYMG